MEYSIGRGKTIWSTPLGDLDQSVRLAEGKFSKLSPNLDREQPRAQRLFSPRRIALGGIGPEAKAAVPALSEALKDEDLSVRTNASYALGQIR